MSQELVDQLKATVDKLESRVDELEQRVKGQGNVGRSGDSNSIMRMILMGPPGAGEYNFFVAVQS